MLYGTTAYKYGAVNDRRRQLVIGTDYPLLRLFLNIAFWWVTGIAVFGAWLISKMAFRVARRNR